LPCIADSSKIRVIASLSDPVDEVFPYLNAALREIAFAPQSKTVTLKKEHRLIAVYPHMVTIAKADDEDDANATLRWLQALINETWERRESITPSFKLRQILRPLDVYSLLPRTNCRQCGEFTCMAFAFGLLRGHRTIEECPQIGEPARRRLTEVMGIDGILKVS
jgi:ArsR family metal-binding transcriptional regulator